MRQSGRAVAPAAAGADGPGGAIYFAVDYDPERRPRLDVHAAAGQHRQEGRQRSGWRPAAPSSAEFYITGAKPWTLEGEINDAYVTEHTHLIESLRAGKPLTELKQIAESSLAGILGREAAYQGGAVTWEQALAMPSLMPTSLEWGPMPTPPVPMPGVTA
jgi:hypothetical protein